MTILVLFWGFYSQSAMGGKTTGPKPGNLLKVDFSNRGGPGKSPSPPSLSEIPKQSSSVSVAPPPDSNGCILSMIGGDASRMSKASIRRTLEEIGFHKDPIINGYHFTTFVNNIYNSIELNRSHTNLIRRDFALTINKLLSSLKATMSKLDNLRDQLQRDFPTEYISAPFNQNIYKPIKNALLIDLHILNYQLIQLQSSREDSEDTTLKLFSKMTEVNNTVKVFLSFISDVSLAQKGQYKTVLQTIQDLEGLPQLYFETLRPTSLLRPIQRNEKMSRELEESKEQEIRTDKTLRQDLEKHPLISEVAHRLTPELLIFKSRLTKLLKSYDAKYVLSKSNMDEESLTIHRLDFIDHVHMLHTSLLHLYIFSYYNADLTPPSNFEIRINNAIEGLEDQLQREFQPVNRFSRAPDNLYIIYAEIQRMTLDYSTLFPYSYINRLLGHALLKKLSIEINAF